MAARNSGNLRRLSGGQVGMAVLILVGVHVVPVLAAWAVWALGLWSGFDHARWVPITLISLIAAVTVLPIFLLFGFWGSAYGPGHAGAVERAFGGALLLGVSLLRLLMQLVLVGGLLFALIFTCVNVRWWNLVGTPEIRDLPARAATIPIPAAWTVEEAWSDVSDDGSNHHPNGYTDADFEVPEGYTVEQLRAWLESGEWTAPSGGGRAFGEIELTGCVTAQATCRAQLVSETGEEPEYFLSADLSAATRWGGPEVSLRLRYEQYVEPDWEVSRTTRARAALLPVPSDWVRSDLWQEDASDGQAITQFFAVPESFTRDDLRAWLDGPTWTAPASGTPFGAISRDRDCTEAAGALICSATVDAAAWENYPAAPRHPLEFLTASLDEDHTVRLKYRRIEDR